MNLINTFFSCILPKNKKIEVVFCIKKIKLILRLLRCFALWHYFLYFFYLMQKIYIICITVMPKKIRKWHHYYCIIWPVYLYFFFAGLKVIYGYGLHIICLKSDFSFFMQNIISCIFLDCGVNMAEKLKIWKAYPSTMCENKKIILFISFIFSIPLAFGW